MGGLYEERFGGSGRLQNESKGWGLIKYQERNGLIRLFVPLHHRHVRFTGDALRKGAIYGLIRLFVPLHHRHVRFTGDALRKGAI